MPSPGPTAWRPRRCVARVSWPSGPAASGIRDPRRYATLEACGDQQDARVAYDLGFDTPAGRLWVASDGGDAAFRVARRGCFRAAVAMPDGATAADARAIRLRAHTRPPRRGEPRLPRGSGSARIDRVTRLFGLGPDDLPGPSVFDWSAGADLRPDGPPFELPIAAPAVAAGSASVPVAVPLAPP